MREGKRGRATMQLGDRIVVNKALGREVYIVARVEVPHSPEKAFITKSGFDFTIGIKVWRSDYSWDEKSRMWMPKG